MKFFGVNSTKHTIANLEAKFRILFKEEVTYIVHSSVNDMGEASAPVGLASDEMVVTGLQIKAVFNQGIAWF